MSALCPAAVLSAVERIIGKADIARTAVRKWKARMKTMTKLKITQCPGEGQGSCKRCSDNGKWNRNWMCFLYKVEGREGCYCSDCIKEIQKESEVDNCAEKL